MFTKERRGTGAKDKYVREGGGRWSGNHQKRREATAFQSSRIDFRL